MHVPGEMEQENNLYPDGLLIAFEGVHGCGKSTQLSLLAGRLAAAELPVTTTKEVTGTPLADRVRDIAMPPQSEAFDDPLIMSLLIAASRASRVKQIIRPALQLGGVVLADRYEGSMLVEQHYCDGVEEGLVRTLNHYVTGGISADVTFVFDVDTDTARSRRAHRVADGHQASGWDTREPSYHARQREGYLHFTATEPGWVLVDGGQSVKTIAEDVYNRTLTAIEQKNRRDR